MQLRAEQSNAQAEPAEEAAQEPAAEAAQGPAEEQAAADEAESSDKMAVAFLCASDNQGFEAGCLGEEHICDSGTESQEEDYEELRARKRNANYNRLIALQDPRKLREAGRRFPLCGSKMT